MRGHHLILAAVLIWAEACWAAETQAPEDVVLKALGDEMGRSMTLRLEGLEAPYFIQYEVDDSTTYRVSATYGALLQSNQSRSRILVSQLRVGADTLDNSNFAGGGPGRGRSSVGDSSDLPTDDDYFAIRHAIWRTTDAQFKEALETLTRKRAYLKDRNLEDRPPDFTKADSVVSIKGRAKLSFERATWEDYVRRISASAREFTQLQSAEVDLAAGVANRYLINSEGTRLRDGQTETLLRITVDGQAEDGQWLTDHLSYFAPTPEQLPPLNEVLKDMKELADRLGQALRAPILDEYSGPVLFEGLAATQLFRQLLVAGIAGIPDAVGTVRRAQGGDDLDNRVGKRILPQTFQVYDDPRDPKFESSFLAGHYSIDDEGVPAQRVNIVVDGKLEAMVMSRTPTKRFTQTNGHGRRGGSESPRSAVGCLYIESSKGLDQEDLKKQLLEAADHEGLKFGLRIAGLQSRSGGGIGPGAGRGGRFRPGGGAGARAVGDPIYVFKVYADGHEEPVRGCEFTTLDFQSLRKILAAGSARTVQNSVIGSTPSSSIIAPSVLIGEVELAQIKAETERKPVLEAPLVRVGAK